MILDRHDPRNYDHWFTHRLGVAFRFVDIFTARPVAARLEVSIPAERWTAVRRQTDHTYRLVFTERPVPTGLFDVEVTAPGGEYVNHRPFQINLPVVAASPPTRSDYLDERPLWPTRGLRLPQGETAIVGRIQSAGANPIDDLEIRIFRQGDPLPATPFAVTDDNGEFLFRLPWARHELSGAIVLPPPTVEIHVTGPGGPIAAVNPATFIPDLGRVRFRTFNIP